MLERVLVEFGEQLGFKGLALNDQGTAKVQIEQEDLLELQLLEHELLMCFSTPRSNIGRKSLLQDLLLFPHPDNLLNFSLQVGVVGEETVVFIARLNLDGLGMDEMMDTLEQLWELKQSLFY